MATNTPNWREEVFIARTLYIEKQSVAARNSGKVTPLLLSLRLPDPSDSATVKFLSY
jgi:hypothetical protein